MTVQAENTPARALPLSPLEAVETDRWDAFVAGATDTPLACTLETSRGPAVYELHLDTPPGSNEAEWTVVGVPATHQETTRRMLHALQCNVSEALGCEMHALYRLDFRRQGYDYISPVVAEITGVDLDSLRADHGVDRLRPRIPESDRARIRTSLAAAVAHRQDGHADCSIEFRLRDVHGQLRWFRDSLRILVDADGTIAYITGAILEITDTRLTSEHLRVTLHSIGDGVISTDASGQITLINPQAVALTGWATDEALGQPAHKVLQLRIDANDAPLPCQVTHVLETGLAHRRDAILSLIRRNGERVPIAQSVFPILMEGDSTPQGAVVVLRDEREARASLERLHESESRYRILVESSPVGIFHFDHGQRITFLNQRFADILGGTPEALVGTSIADLADTSILPTIQAALRGQPGRYEGAFLADADNPSRRLSIRTAPAFGADEAVMGGVGIVEDYTARYEAERKLRESEARYALAMRGTNEGLWDWNPITKELFLSSRLMALLGEPPESVRTTSDAWLARLHPDDRSIYYTRMVAHLKGETHHFEFEFRLATHGGDYRWFRSRGVAQRDDAGVAYRMVGSIGDITARKRAQIQLTNELTFSRTLVDSLPVGLCVTQTDGTVTMINQFFARLVGVSTRDLNAIVTSELVTESDRPVMLQRMEKAFEDGSAWLETAVLATHGREVPVHLLIRRVKLYDTEQLLCIATDISERRRAEAQMRNLNRDLELRVQDRTAQLAAAVKELEAFSYSVSHDLRAPLRAIDGYTRIIREDFQGAFNDEAHMLFERMLAAVARMSELIDDLLELSRVSRRPLQRATLDMSLLARNVAAELEQRDAKRRIGFHIDDDMSVVADEKLLKIAIENLLGNAWKFTAKRESAQIGFHREHQHGEAVYCVEDNGAGFDMRYADKLFGAFQRLHTDRDFEGTGIGLATVARIIQRHGGRVWATSEPDQGARFYFTLGGDPDA